MVPVVVAPTGVVPVVTPARVVAVIPAVVVAVVPARVAVVPAPAVVLLGLDDLTRGRGRVRGLRSPGQRSDDDGRADEQAGDRGSSDIHGSPRSFVPY